MRVINTTPLTTHVAVSVADDGTRRVSLFAKATFSFDAAGGLAKLNGDDPDPIRLADEETEAGVFPRDDLLSDDGGFEVFFHGSAHAPGGRPVGELEVALTVDDERRTLRVFGDRVWTGELPSTVPSAPKPFVTMPIAPSTSFGGAWMIEVDQGAVVPFVHSANPHGKGFVVAGEARALSTHLCADAGFPKLPSSVTLPNAEHPTERIVSSDDAPAVAHWAAHPLGYVPVDPSKYTAAQRPTVDLRRAHPDWRLGQRARMPAKLLLEHLSASSARVSVPLPGGNAEADLLFGEGVTRSVLAPRRLCVMPDACRVAVLFAATWITTSAINADRALRIRWEGAEE